MYSCLISILSQAISASFFILQQCKLRAACPTCIHSPPPHTFAPVRGSPWNAFPCGLLGKFPLLLLTGPWHHLLHQSAFLPVFPLCSVHTSKCQRGCVMSGIGQTRKPSSRCGPQDLMLIWGEEAKKPYRKDKQRALREDTCRSRNPDWLVGKVFPGQVMVQLRSH